ncbi:hypothetical protein [Formosa sp. A9]|uniref:hypothetical protein n=1 Tax=Formosa sp. A9 TaxID=3442641 RepID=UPI003EBFECED
MKKINFMSLCLIVCLIFLSCSSDSGDENTEVKESSYEEMIIGKWVVEYQWEGEPKDNYEEYVNMPQLDPENTSNYTDNYDENDADTYTTFLYRTDGTVYIEEWGESYTKEYYVEGNRIYFSRTGDSGDWKYYKIFDFKKNYLVARKLCKDESCEGETVEVRYYRKIN